MELDQNPHTLPRAWRAITVRCAYRRDDVGCLLCGAVCTALYPFSVLSFTLSPRILHELSPSFNFLCIQWIMGEPLQAGNDPYAFVTPLHLYVSCARTCAPYAAAPRCSKAPPACW